MLLANHPRPSFQKEGKAAGFPQCYGCAAAEHSGLAAELPCLVAGLSCLVAGTSLSFVGSFPAFRLGLPAPAAAYPAFGASRFFGQKLSKGHLPQWGFRAVHT